MLDARRIEQRLRKRFTVAEVGAVALAVGLLLVFVALKPYGPTGPPDFVLYWRADRFTPLPGYPYWARLFFAPFSLLPLYVGYIVWSLMSLAAVIFAVRVFDGPLALVVSSYQMLYVLYYGNIIGLLVGALALTWWGFATKRLHLAGLGLLIACIKPHIGLTIGMGLWLLADLSWRERFLTLIVPTSGVLLSLIVYPGWPVDIIVTFQSDLIDSLGNISLWQWVGPFSLVLWLPIFFMRRLTVQQRLLLIACAALLSVPYYAEQTDLLAVMMFPIGWVALVGNLGYLFIIEQWGFFWVLALVPLVAYGMTLVQAVRYNQPHIEMSE